MFIKEMSIGPMEQKVVIVVPTGYQCRDFKVESLRHDEDNNDIRLLEYESDCLVGGENITIHNHSPCNVRYYVSGHFTQAA
jgi:hypothetical protein